MTGNACETLLERWRTQGDSRALGELFEPYRDRAYATAFRILGQGSDAEDAVQNAFIKLLSRTHGFENAQEFQRAVFRAVVQCALDQARQCRRGQQRREAMSRMSDERTPALAWDSAESATEHAETRTALREALQRLAEEERVAVVLCCEQELPLGEVAALLETPRQTLRDRLDRALENLRTDLRRCGIALSLALLASLLKQEGALAAPPTLCAKLDTLLATGKPSQALTTKAALKGATALKVGVAGTLAAALALFLARPESPERLEMPDTPPAPNSSASVALPEKSPDVATGHAGPSRLHPLTEPSTRSSEMKPTTLAKMTLATAMLAVPLANASEKDDVEAVLKEIRAHKAEKEKAAAEEKARLEKQGGNVQWSAGGVGYAPGATINFRGEAREGATATTHVITVGGANPAQIEIKKEADKPAAK